MNTVTLVIQAVGAAAFVALAAVLLRRLLSGRVDSVAPSVSPTPSDMPRPAMVPLVPCALCGCLPDCGCSQKGDFGADYSYECPSRTCKRRGNCTGLHPDRPAAGEAWNRRQRELALDPLDGEEDD